MLYKGKRDGYYLYELTGTDLIWEVQEQGHYRVGNVLLFASKKDIALGSELVKADDLATAFDYLQGDVEYVEDTGGVQQEALATLEQQLAQSDAQLRWRDSLLHELATDLESQRNSNKMLIAQLENLREQINIEQLTRNEVMGDLEIASAETYRKEQELQEAMDAKAQLEQELAARICELLELDSANTDLEKRLESHAFGGPEVHAPQGTDAPGATDAPDIPAATGIPHTTAAASVPPLLPRAALPEAQVFTTPNGKLIQVYHEFPASRSKRRQKGSTALAGVLRAVGLLLLGILLFIGGSVLATARLNDLSLGEALDMTLKTLVP
ncbi:MAG: hypothetical protein LBL23_01920 [Coriobacteriales bacterium]|jgi:hypothetical protein|nr:hypothetical protein [Coriobacteriales bacterium]